MIKSANSTNSRARSMQLGFTLTELMIAMALFSFILLFAVNAFIQINRIYTKGITLKRMNDQARTIMSDLTNDLQQVSREPIINDSSYYACLPSLKVAYVWSETNPGDFQRGSYTGACDDSGAPTLSSSNSEKLIDDNTNVKLKLKYIADPGVVEVDLVLSTADDSKIDSSGVCKGGYGDQYCGVAHLTSVVRLIPSDISSVTIPTPPLPPTPPPPPPTPSGTDLAGYYPNADRMSGYYLEGKNALKPAGDDRSVLAFHELSDDGSFRQYNYGPEDWVGSDRYCHWDAMRWTDDGLEYFETRDKCSNGHDNDTKYTPGVIILPPATWKFGDAWSKSGSSATVYVDNTSDKKCPDGSSFRVTGTNVWSSTVDTTKVHLDIGADAIHVRSLQTTTWNAPNCLQAGERVAGDVTKYEENYYLVDNLPVSDGGTDYALKRDVGGNISSPGNPLDGQWQFDVWFDSWQPLPGGWSGDWSL